MGQSDQFEFEAAESLGEVTIEPVEGASRLSEGVAGVSILDHCRYTWRPGAKLSTHLPAGYHIKLDCLTGDDGVRRFTPTGGVGTFIPSASVGGLAILVETKSLPPETRFTYDTMRLLFQHSPRLQEHLERGFRRESDLYMPRGERAGRGRKDILPASIGLNCEGRGTRWTVPELMRHGRAQALLEGTPRPDEGRCLSTGLLLAARFDPIEPNSLSEAEAQALVRMSLFEAGPVTEVDEHTREAVIERFFAALKSHLEDDTEVFDRWFFGKRDDLVHRIAKQIKHGGPISREAVRQVLLNLVFDSYQYVGDCLCLQMQAFLQELPEPLTPQERAFFETFYFKQEYLGGLPLILLRDRFAFLKGAILNILDSPGEPWPIGVLLRLLSYYEEMSSARREVDRDRKRQNACGAKPRQGPFDADVSCTSASALGGRRRTLDERRLVIERLRVDRGLRCRCEHAGTWAASLAGNDVGSNPSTVQIEFGCTECGFSEIMQIDPSELEMNHEIMQIDPSELEMNHREFYDDEPETLD